LDVGEVVLWSGKPGLLRKGFAASFIAIGFVFAVFVFSLVPRYGLSDVEAGFIPTFLLIYNLYFVWAVRGVDYYVTDRRVLKKSPRVLLKRTEEVPLSTVIDVRARRFLGTNQLVFRTSEGKTLTFRALRQDPQSIRQIAIDAKKKGLS
jgi:hypothetical protein